MVSEHSVAFIPSTYPQHAVATSSTAQVSPTSWEENTGLLASLIPDLNGSSVADVHAFNSSKGDLKLGPAPVHEELRTETERVLREQAMIDPSVQFDAHFGRTAGPSGLTAPSKDDLPPHPPNFRTIDVKREVEKVKDQRKRIRLEPSTVNTANINTPQGRARALPSVCTYTLHDAGEGSVASYAAPPFANLTPLPPAASHVSLFRPIHR